MSITYVLINVSPCFIHEDVYTYERFTFVAFPLGIRKVTRWLEQLLLFVCIYTNVGRHKIKKKTNENKNWCKNCKSDAYKGVLQGVRIVVTGRYILF